MPRITPARPASFNGVLPVDRRHPPSTSGGVTSVVSTAELTPATGPPVNAAGAPESTALDEPFHRDPGILDAMTSPETFPSDRRRCGARRRLSLKRQRR
jgi:hypothetical protein